jgi:transcriptional regulator with XRE-family HTH domain
MEVNYKDFKLISIKEARQDKGLTQEELAKFAYIERPHLSQIESGKINPTWNTTKALAKVLKERPLDLAIGQILENVEIEKGERQQALQYLIDNPKIQRAAKGILKVEKDFGGRDFFGRKKAIKEKGFRRDSFGIRRGE